MRSITVNVLLVFAAQVNADQAANQVVGNLLNKLIDRVSQESLLSYDGEGWERLDDTTLGKAAMALATPVRGVAMHALPASFARPQVFNDNLKPLGPLPMANDISKRVGSCAMRARQPFNPPAAPAVQTRAVRAGALGKDEPVVVIGVAADSGCGKSTFMRRLTNVFGGEKVGPLGGGFDNGGWETNTLVSDQTTVICLDDYHLNDRQGRKVSGLTALNTKEQKFDLMAEQIAALKRGETVKKPIYNHVNGTLDTPEEIKPTPILIIEGLHPFVDERVRKLLDFSIYLDITDDVKFAWKVQRDMQERGHSLESIKSSIDARKPDFDAYVAPQRAQADLVIQVLPTELTNDETGKILKVKFIQKVGKDNFEPAYLFDEGSTVEWVPCGKKLTCDFPGIKLKYGPDMWFENEVSVIEMDGQFNNVDELCYIEDHLANLDTKFYGELTQSMVKAQNSPGSNNGSGFFQNLAAFKLRALYEKVSGKVMDATPA